MFFLPHIFHILCILKVCLVLICRLIAWCKVPTWIIINKNQSTTSDDDYGCSLLPAENLACQQTRTYPWDMRKTAASFAWEQYCLDIYFARYTKYFYISQNKSKPNLFSHAFGRNVHKRRIVAQKTEYLLLRKSPVSSYKVVVSWCKTKSLNCSHCSYLQHPGAQYPRV